MRAVLYRCARHSPAGSRRHFEVNHARTAQCRDVDGAPFVGWQHVATFDSATKAMERALPTEHRHTGILIFFRVFRVCHGPMD